VLQYCGRNTRAGTGLAEHTVLTNVRGTWRDRFDDELRGRGGLTEHIEEDHVGGVILRRAEGARDGWRLRGCGASFIGAEPGMSLTCSKPRCLSHRLGFELLSVSWESYTGACFPNRQTSSYIYNITKILHNSFYHNISNKLNVYLEYYSFNLQLEEMFVEGDFFVS
jgi:hypothetical protein